MGGVSSCLARGLYIIYSAEGLGFLCLSAIAIRTSLRTSRCTHVMLIFAVDVLDSFMLYFHQGQSREPHCTEPSSKILHTSLSQRFERFIWTLILCITDCMHIRTNTSTSYDRAMLQYLTHCLYLMRGSKALTQLPWAPNPRTRKTYHQCPQEQPHSHAPHRQHQSAHELHPTPSRERSSL